MAKKPIYGMLLSLIGGIIMVIAGALVALGMISYGLGVFLPPLQSSILTGAVGIIFGILVILLGYLGYAGKGKMLGIIVLILGILNLFVGSDFFVLGSILAIIGGLLLYLEK